ncbi:SdpI family protein [Spirosoma luteolum]
MNKKTSADEYLMAIPWILSLTYIALVWHQIPDRLATHFDLTGQPNGWMGKPGLLLTSLALGVFVYGLLRTTARPSLPAAKRHLLDRLRFVVNLFMAALPAGLFYMATGTDQLATGNVTIMALTGLFIAAVGNYTISIKPNPYVGVRTPWTLRSERVWMRSNRLGGRLMVAGGLLSSVLALLVPAPYMIGAVVTMVLITALIPVVYSYVYYRQEQAGQLTDQ